MKKEYIFLYSYAYSYKNTHFSEPITIEDDDEGSVISLDSSRQSIASSEQSSASTRGEINIVFNILTVTF